MRRGSGTTTARHRDVKRLGTKTAPNIVMQGGTELVHALLADDPVDAMTRSDDTANDRGLTVWNIAAPDTRWFQPSSASFMNNLDRRSGRHQAGAVGADVLGDKN